MTFDSSSIVSMAPEPDGISLSATKSALKSISTVQYVRSASQSLRWVGIGVLARLVVRTSDEIKHIGNRWPPPTCSCIDTNGFACSVGSLVVMVIALTTINRIVNF